MIEFFIFIAAVFAGIYVLLTSVYLVRQSEAMVVERLGKYEKILTPGVHFLIPFVETPRPYAWTYFAKIENRWYRTTQRSSRVDLREHAYDFPKQNVITKDNVTLEINAIVYYQVTDPKAAIYEIKDMPEALEKLVQTTLRNVIGHIDLDETLISRDSINTKLQIILDEATDKWGVKVNRVELQDIHPPADIRQAMEKQMRAERDRRATILEAEGKKRAAILESEGIQESRVLEAKGLAEAKVINAEGEATARLKVAEAEAKAIEMIKGVTHTGDPLAYMIATQYIKTLPQLMEGKNDKLVVVPYEASSLAGALSSIKALFQQKD